MPRAALARSHLSEDVARQGLIEAGMAVDECKEVQAGAVLLHHQLKEPLIFKYIQHLERHKLGVALLGNLQDNKLENACDNSSLP